jgi:hypothetical protein
MDKSFLDVTEQLTVRDDLPDGFRVYSVDGHVIWAHKEFSDYLQSLADAVQNFIDAHPFGNTGDDQEAVEGLCEVTGLLKPCYGEWCVGCDYGDEGCASPDAPNQEHADPSL